MFASQDAATALRLASKHEDIYRVWVEDIAGILSAGKKNALKESDVLALELEFYRILSDFAAPTTTAFAHRYQILSSADT